MKINPPPSEFLDAKRATAERIAAGSPEPKAPKTLALSSIETLPELFQQRRITPEESDSHVQSLARAIKRGPRGAHQAALEPITVFWVGDAWACADGHHRLQAYRTVSHAAPVPVKALTGVTLEAAIVASLGGNSKDKLSLSPRCKTEAAWRFVLSGKLSKATIAGLAGVDESTIAAMRKALREFCGANAGQDGTGLTWAQMRLWKHPPLENDGRDAAERAAERLLRHTEKHLKGASPRVIFLALGMHNPGLMAELVQMHIHHKESEAYQANPFGRILSPDEEFPEF